MRTALLNVRCIDQGSNLFYFDSPKSAKPIGFLPLEGATIEPGQEAASEALQRFVIKVQLHSAYTTAYGPRSLHTAGAPTPDAQVRHIWISNASARICASA